MGEALSNVTATLFYPQGYYAGGIGPRITQWLNQNPRPDYISSNKLSDTDFVSFGCGIVFIYYLQDQLGYSIGDIITKAGATLEATYKNLTGNTGGFTALENLLNLYIPEGTRYDPSIDDLFPLHVVPTSLTLSPTSVVCGNLSIGTITLDHAYSAGPLTASLLSAAPGFASVVPNTTTILASAASANFGVTTPSINTPFPPAQADIFATLGGRSVSATLKGSPQRSRWHYQKPNSVSQQRHRRQREYRHGNAGERRPNGYAGRPGGRGDRNRSPSSAGTRVFGGTCPLIDHDPSGSTTGSFRIQTSVLLPPTVTRTATIIAGAVITKYALLTVGR
jgi:hypothetical protein